MVDAIAIAGLAWPIAHDASRKCLSDLDHGRVVKKRQRLERGVGAQPSRASLHASGRIEGRQERKRRGSPEERIDAPSKSIWAAFRRPLAPHLAQAHDS